MNVNELMCGVPVRDFSTARAWYERFFDRDAEVVATDVEHLWQLNEQSWLYIVHDPTNAGHGIVAVTVGDLDAAIAELTARGIETGTMTQEAPDAFKSVVRDPDGNSIALVGSVSTQQA
jgi:hypothetical protein